MTANYKEETLKLLRAIYRDGMEDLIAYLENDTDFSRPGKYKISQ